MTLRCDGGALAGGGSGSGGGGGSGLPLADLSGYDLYTDPQSALFGSGCDPPSN